jgi:hypothetical protein
MEQDFESKYFDVDEYFKNVMEPLGWTKEEFIYALRILEELPLEKLKEIFEEKFGIKYSPNYNLTEDDYFVLIDEVDKEELLNELRKIEKGQ